MKPSSYTQISHEKITSTGTSDTKTATIPRATSAIWITVESNPMRVTFDGTDPAGGTGMVVQQNNNPWFLPMGPATQLRLVSTTGTAIAQLAYIQ